MLLRLAEAHGVPLLFVTNNVCNKLLKFQDAAEVAERMGLGQGLLRRIGDVWFGLPHLQGGCRRRVGWGVGSVVGWGCSVAVCLQRWGGGGRNGVLWSGVCGLCCGWLTQNAAWVASPWTLGSGRGGPWGCQGIWFNGFEGLKDKSSCPVSTR